MKLIDILKSSKFQDVLYKLYRDTQVEFINNPNPAIGVLREADFIAALKYIKPQSVSYKTLGGTTDADVKIFGHPYEIKHRSNISSVKYTWTSEKLKQENFINNFKEFKKGLIIVTLQNNKKSDIKVYTKRMLNNNLISTGDIHKVFQVSKEDRNNRGIALKSSFLKNIEPLHINLQDYTFDNKVDRIQKRLLRIA